ncbi:uncharacterized protein [Acropora muricata]|uniref:uncharacterized protein isoform X4 n=1 Tax=Acropora muricata TaxID=159855 RepID=UPI0034E55BA2
MDSKKEEETKNTDRLGISSPTSRDKLLAAVHELKLFGGPVPDERQFRLNVPANGNKGFPNPRNKRRSLPTRPSNMQLQNGSLNSQFDAIERKTPQEVLFEQSDEMSLDPKEGKVTVFTRGLQADSEYTTVEITTQTTSKELVSLLLAKCKAGEKDRNLFYIAVEIGIQKKDSSLPLSQMMVLANDARPLEIQSRQPTGEAKFHLKMRSGGILRVQAGILSPGATYKCVQISHQTRADEVVRMIMHSYGSDEAPEKFVLVESLPESEVGRILEPDECPLEVQSRWKAGEQRTFTLTQAEFEGILQSDNDKQITADSRLQVISIDCGRNTVDGDHPPDFSNAEKDNLELIRKRGTSIDALDLEIGHEANHVKRKISQIDNLRHKFHEYQEFQRKPNSRTAVEESVLSAEEAPKKRKVSQIDLFRSKFLAYANYASKGEAPNSFTPLTEQVRGNDNDKENKASLSNSSPRAESSDGEDLPRFSSSPPPHLRVKNKHSDEASNRENQKNARKRSHPPQLTLGSVLQNCKLVTLTLSRMQGEGWGIELVHVTVTGSSSNGNKDSKENEKVVYVQHNGDGQNSIVNTSSILDSSMDLINSSETSSRYSPNSSESSEQEIASILIKTSHSLTNGDKSTDDMLQMVHKQNLRRRMGVTQGLGSNDFIKFAPDPNQILSRPGSASPDRPINPLPQRPSSALAQWKKEGSPQPRPGVRIVALTEGGVAEASGQLETDDLIIEINGQFVLNSPLEPVIAAMQEGNTVCMVVARAKDPEKQAQKERKTDYRDELQALTLQIQNLVTKVSEMQSDLKKKDDKIKTLKKMVKKNSSADSKGKIYESVQVLV